MRKNWILIAAIVLVISGVGGFFLRSKFISPRAGLLIETNPAAQVFINGQASGSTPFEQTLAPSEATLRLIPVAGTTPLSPWGTKVTLASGIKTVIRRDFAETEAASSGEILSFEKIGGNSASLSLVSSPDSAQVVVDGNVRGFTPMRVDSVSVGEHQIVVSRPGFISRTLTPNTLSGYRLTAVVMLGEAPEATPSAETGAPPLSQAQVEILQTPTGFLRVRSEPRTSATELVQVKPGEKYPLVEENKEGTWFKIEYEDGKEGWISAQYAQKVEGEKTP